jgi:hypothetical protein
MSVNNMRAARIGYGLLLLWAAVSAFQYPAWAETPRDSTFALVAYFGGGYSLYAAEITPPADIPSTIQRGGLSGSVRVMWHPDRLLRVGVESGWTRFFSYTLHGNNDGHLNLTAIPLLVVFSMPIGERINLFAGGGGYFVSSNLDFGTVVRVDEFSQGWMFAASYVFPLSPGLGLAAELKCFNASQFEDVTLTVQAQLVWKFLEW